MPISSESIINFLQQRRSETKLTSPGPDLPTLLEILKAAVAIPDHGQLHPWRFVVVEQDARKHLNDALIQAIKLEQHTDKDLDKAAGMAFRSPTIITTIHNPISHPKISKQEQFLSAGCAAYAIVLACEAVGFGAVWRTGALINTQPVRDFFHLSLSEKIVGFIYIGTPMRRLPFTENTSSTKPRVQRVNPEGYTTWLGSHAGEKYNL